jgi:hypothetical protein
MPSQDWNDDDELMRDLGEIFRPSPAERQVIDAARGLRMWRLTADQQLAALLYDSYLDESARVRAGRDSEPQTLVFGHGSVQVEVELSDSGIEGQFVPPSQGLVRLFTVTGPHCVTTVDEVGCFAFPPPPRGPIRLECAVTSGTFFTEWIGAHTSQPQGRHVRDAGDGR